MSPPAGPVVRLVAVQEAPLDVAAVLAAVAHPAAGATSLFVGAVRDHDGGRGVTGLGYQAHPSATAALEAVAAGVVADFPVLALAAVHRIGELVVGDVTVVTAVSCAHRDAAFAACRRLIDDLKAQVPIWKQQQFDDGTQEWVGSP